MHKPTHPLSAVVSDTAADWIAKHVLTQAYIKSCGSVELIRTSACQYGSCGYCASGQHAKCSHRQTSEWRPAASPVTHILTRRGGALTGVWMSGRACRWFCDCQDCAAPAATQTPPAIAYRAVKGDIRPGDSVWLVPKTAGAAAVCWSQPRALVVSIARNEPYLVVQVDGQEHRIHADNVRRSDPSTPREKGSRVSKQRPAMPDGFAEVPLF